MKIRTKLPIRVFTLLMAVVVQLTMVGSGLAEIQWPEQLVSFERRNPAYDESVDVGTEKSALHLPETLRAVVGIPKNMDVSTFVQAKPAASITDGTESYDYYHYGYVAPKGAAEFYAAGNKVIYSIYYAAKEDNGTVGEVGYRLYGSIAGSEKLWFTCDEAGTITGAVLDIPVTWNIRYDANTPGKYICTASIASGCSYVWNGAAPTAEITVNKTADTAAEADEVTSSTAAGTEAGSTETGTAAGEVTSSTAAGTEAGSTETGTAAGEVTSSTAAGTEAGSTEIGTAAGKVMSSTAAGTEAGSTETSTAVGEVTSSTAAGTEAGSIETGTAAGKVTSSTAAGTEAGSTETGTAAGEVTSSTAAGTEAGSTKTGTAAGEVTSSTAAGTEAGSVAGTAAEGSSKVSSNITGNETNSGEISNAATAGSQGETEGKCTCGVAEDSFPWQHAENCPCFSPVECECRDEIKKTVHTTDEDGNPCENTITLPGELSGKHDPENMDCPLYGREVVKIHKLAADEYTYMAKTDAEAIAAAQEQGKILYPALGKIEIVDDHPQESKAYDTDMKLLSINGGGANDTRIDNAILGTLITSGNAAYADEYAGKSIPGTWYDYVCTIARNYYNTWAWTPHAATGAYHGWEWNGTSASQTSGSVANNRFRIPAATNAGGAWFVYSGEQMRYAFTHLQDGQTVRVMGNIDMNGDNYNWNSVTFTNVTLRFTTRYDPPTAAADPNSYYTVYNLGIGTANNGSSATMFSVYNWISPHFCKIDCLNFKSVKVASLGNLDQGICGLFCVLGNTTDRNTAIRNVTITNSMFANNRNYNTSMSPFGRCASYSLNQVNDVIACDMYNCYSQNNIIISAGHPGGLDGFAASTNIDHCYAVNNQLFGLKYGHGGMLISCAAGYVQASNSFTAGSQMWAVAAVGGLIGGPEYDMRISNCYASGKIEAYSIAGGLIGQAQSRTTNRSVRVVQNCYSTTLIGLRSGVEKMGGFIGNYKSNGTAVAPLTISNCYAAGEVGNFTTNMNAPATTGGFISSTSLMGEGGAYTLSNCYYDKQTTAMREWAAGDTKTLSGVTGVLTTTTAKDGTGLASGAIGGGGDVGFRGFSDNSQWAYSAQHYPQLSRLAYASTADWGSAAEASLVQAFSKASAATVFLDIWDSGYDWNIYGVRSAGEVSYNRAAADHTGGSTTYDTVREIISPFTVTNNSANSTYWSEIVPGGLNASDGATTTQNTIKISGGAGAVNNPGMNWYSVSEAVSGQTGARPLRLIAYMKVNAGADRDVMAGTLYNHRSDVALTMMNTITDNLVIGLDNAKIWSTFKTGGYATKSDTDPAFSDRYYAAATDHTNNMLTQFSASQGAWINTEIWRAQRNADGTYPLDTSGNLIPDYSVKVTGAGTGNNATLDEQKWNGTVPLYPDIISGQKYIISYYWQLKDGRYVTDSKVIDVAPGVQTLTTDVYNNSDSSENAFALKLDNAQDSGSSTNYVIPAAASQTETLSAIPYGTNVTAAWSKANADTIVKKIAITFTDRQGNQMGTQTVTGNNLAEGTAITVPTYYYYLTTETDSVQGRREVTKASTVSVTYTLQKDAGGNYYLRFNQLNNPGNVQGAGVGSSVGIPAGTEAYINELSYNTQVDIYVDQSAYIRVKKVVSNYTDAMAGQLFMVRLTGGVNAQVALKNGETSKRLTTVVGSSKSFDLSEIVPMEYSLTDITLTNTGSGTAPTLNLVRNAAGVVTGGTATLYPGNEILVTVTNQFTHEGYFKGRTNAENVFSYNPLIIFVPDP